MLGEILTSQQRSAAGTAPPRRGHDGLLTGLGVTGAFWFTVMIAAVAVGAWARVKGLGTWPLALDEYYLARSIENILERGLPQFESGGFYDRGLLQQYIGALLLRTVDADPHAVLRSISVAANLAAMPALFILGRKLGGRVVAFLAVTMFALSLWEIEFARFLRMYAPFQAIFVWYLLCLYNIVVEGRADLRKWLYVLSVASVFVYEGAAFLVGLNFLPFLLRWRLPRAAELVAPVAALALALASHVINFRQLGAEPGLPPDLPEITGWAGSGLPIELPPLLAATLPLAGGWGIGFAVVLGASITAVWHAWARRDVAMGVRLASMTLVGLTALNLFGLALYGAILLFLLDRGTLRGLFSRAAMPAALVATVNLAFWSAYVLVTDHWDGLLRHGNEPSAWHAIGILVDYPDVASKIVFQWLGAIPLTTLILGAVIAAAAAWRAADGVPAGRFELLLALLVVLCLGVALLPQPYYSPRYTFFLYPLVILLAARAMRDLADRIGRTAGKSGLVLAGLLSGYFALAEDFDLAHLTRIDSKDVNFRLVYDRERAAHYYPRADYRTPAEEVNRLAEEGDLIVSTSAAPEYYLRRLDYIIILDARRLVGTAARRGTTEVWTNARLLFRDDDVMNLLRSTRQPLWLIFGDAFLHTPGLLDPLEARIAAEYADAHVYTSLDGRLQLYRIEPRAPDDAPGQGLPASVQGKGAAVDPAEAVGVMPTEGTLPEEVPVPADGDT